MENYSDNKYRLCTKGIERGEVCSNLPREYENDFRPEKGIWLFMFGI